LALLDIQDPVVELGFNPRYIDQDEANAFAAARKSYKAAKHGAPMTPLQRYAYNHDYGLHCSMDPATLLPRYRLEVNVQQLFGVVQVDNRQGQVWDVLNQLERDRLLDLTSHSSYIT